MGSINGGIAFFMGTSRAVVTLGWAPKENATTATTTAAKRLIILQLATATA
jgi:hypothetical protein